jgi:DNA-binding GntR family transcriptional regulator
LIYDGLAEHAMHRGAVVTSIDPSGFSDLLEVRQLLEGLAARLAAERITKAAIDELGATLREHATVVAGGDLYANVELDVRFHTIIRAAAGNHDLDAMLARTMCRAHLSLHTLWRGPRDPQAMLSEHRAIYAAIAARDAAAAEAAAHAHIEGLRHRVGAGYVGFEHRAGVGE